MMSQYACLFFPLPPTSNNLFPTSGKFRIKSRQYRDWLAEAQIALSKQKPTPAFDGYVDLTISVEPTRGDISNRIKAVEDFLVANGIIPDDSNVRRVMVEWNCHVIGCRVQIESAPCRHAEDAARRVS